jgi:hypothetical protein
MRSPDASAVAPRLAHSPDGRRLAADRVGCASCCAPKSDPSSGHQPSRARSMPAAWRRSSDLFFSPQTPGARLAHSIDGSVLQGCRQVVASPTNGLFVDAGDLEQQAIGIYTVLLAEATNLGLAKMAQACPEYTYRQLAWIADWYVRDETCRHGLASIINAQHRHPFAAHWGEGTTSSSDAQQFPVGGRSASIGQVNAHYGPAPGVKLYTHLSDQYGPYHTTTISATASEARRTWLMGCSTTRRTSRSLSIIQIPGHLAPNFRDLPVTRLSLRPTHSRSRRQAPAPVREGLDLSHV